MDVLDNSKGLASPYSTGGGGVEFENHVGAFYLAMALCGAVPRGQIAGVVREVRFQQLFAGEYLDDIVVVSELALVKAKLALQVKRDVTFSENNETFHQVLLDCWNTFKAPEFAPDIDRLGIALGLYNKTVAEHYQTVLAWARNSSSAPEFLSKISIQRLSSAQQRKFVALIRTKLSGYLNGEVADEDLWRFLRAMVILHFDFEEEGSRDYSHLTNLLRYAISPEDGSNAQNLFSRLVDYTAEAKRTAGSLNRAGLIARLGHEGFHFLPELDCRSDLARLDEHGGFIINEIADDVGGITLNRTSTPWLK